MGRRKKSDGMPAKDLGDDSISVDRSSWQPAPPNIPDVPEGSRRVFSTRSHNGLKAKKREPVAPVTIVDKRVQEEKATRNSTEIVIHILNQIADVVSINIGNIKYTGLNSRSITTWVKKDILHILIAGDSAEQKITVHGENLESVKERLQTIIRKNHFGWKVKE